MPAMPPNRPCCPPARGTRPLPDPAAVRMCLIPDPAPPYDGEVFAAAQADGRHGGGEDGGGRAGASQHPQQPLADSPGASERPPQSLAGHADRVHRAGPATAEAAARLPGNGRSSPVPAHPGWPSRFAQVLAETLAGSRPARQMASWTTERARGHIQQLGAQLASGQQPRVRRVVTFCPAADVMEMAVVVGFGPRIRALAVRLERAGPAASGPQGDAARWLCTAVEAA